MDGEIGRTPTPKEQSEINRNRAEEKKLLQEAAEISARLAFSGLKIGLTGGISGIALFFVVYKYVLPIWDLERTVASLQAQKIELQKEQAETALQIARHAQSEAEKARSKAESIVADAKAQSDYLKQDILALQAESEGLRAERDSLNRIVANLGRVQEQLKAARLEASQSTQARIRTEREKAEVERETAKTRQDLANLSQQLERLNREKVESVKAAAELRRCQEFSVLQKRPFRIPGLDYTLKIGDMTDNRVMRLEVLKGGRARVGRVEEKIEGQRELVFRDGDTELSVTFLSIEVQNLIPGVREDSGLVKICTDQWNDAAR